MTVVRAFRETNAMLDEDPELAAALAEVKGLTRETRPEIQLHAGQLPATVDEAERALAGSGTYQRGNQLVRAIRAAPVTVRGVWRDGRALSLVSISASHLVDTLTRSVTFLKWDGRADKWKPVNCPGEVATTLLSRVGQWTEKYLPSLVGILETPTLRPDGSVLSEDGYDHETGLLVDLGGVTFPEIPPTPTQLDAARALELLTEILKSFPFVEETDRSAAAAALLTGLVRRSLQTAPLFTFTAPKPRSGKSLLADLGGLLATGRRPAMVTFTGDAAEEKKRLMALLSGGDPVICFDNISAPIGGDALCTILTQPTWTDRILGRNDAGSAATVPTCATFTATGNNLVVEADLAARALPCRIDAAVEHPEEREFDVNLYEEVPRRRPELVAAGLTILKAYHVAGRPPQGRPAWGGFDDWCRWVRDPLVWLGMADPVEGRKHVEANDPVHQKLVGLLSTWHEALRSVPHTTADAVRASGFQNPAAEALRGALLEIAGTPHGDINMRTLGRFLAGHADRIEGGLVLRRDGRRHGGAPAWRVFDVSAEGAE
ncbi:MAG: hypothetical protein ACYDBY_15210 [Thermoanaerobaculia bacterium]